MVYMLRSVWEDLDMKQIPDVLRLALRSFYLYTELYIETNKQKMRNFWKTSARLGLEPLTSGLRGRRSNHSAVARSKN